MAGEALRLRELRSSCCWCSRKSLRSVEPPNSAINRSWASRSLTTWARRFSKRVGSRTPTEAASVRSASWSRGPKVMDGNKGLRKVPLSTQNLTRFAK